MFRYLQARNPNTDTEHVRTFVDKRLDVYDWLVGLGIEFEGPLVTE